MTITASSTNTVILGSAAAYESRDEFPDVRVALNKEAVQEQIQSAKSRSLWISPSESKTRQLISVLLSKHRSAKDKHFSLLMQHQPNPETIPVLNSCFHHVAYSIDKDAVLAPNELIVALNAPNDATYSSSALLTTDQNVSRCGVVISTQSRSHSPPLRNPVTGQNPISRNSQLSITARRSN